MASIIGGCEALDVRQNKSMAHLKVSHKNRDLFVAVALFLE